MPLVILTGFTLVALAPASLNSPVRSVSFDSFKGWSSRSVSYDPSKSPEIELISPPIDPGLDWNELIPSWTVDPVRGSWIEVEVRALREGEATPFYSFGRWSDESLSFGAETGGRTSRDKQADTLGKVSTDTLVLTSPARIFEVRVRYTFDHLSAALNHPRFRRLTFNVLKTDAAPLARDSNKAVWGKMLDVPKLCQGDYPNGNVICSPTSTAMLIQFWGVTIHRPDWMPGVPEVVEQVYDVAYKGTGNWPFNTAYAGKLGLIGEVHRLADTRDLEDLIGSGIPVACSVSYALLRGKDQPDGNDGHIVVLVGFNESGDPVFNDPGKRDVRQTYKRAAFAKAWANSERTVYLIHPPEIKRPKLSIDP